MIRDPGHSGMDSPNTESMSLYTTDALPNREVQSVVCFSKKSIDGGVLQRVERELEEYEKISILFLLAADKPGAYEKVIELCKNIQDRPCIVTEFVGNDMESWSDKILEALLIIDNREVLRNLGYDKSVLTNRCFDIPCYSVKIHAVSKVLYKLFESLGQEKSKTLLKYIYEEDQIERKLNDSYYLELHALYWLHIDYIRISGAGGNLSKLLRHLKRMDYYDTTIYHDMLKMSSPSNQSDSCGVERPALLQEPEPPAQNDDEQPNENFEIRNGKCVIINEVRFPRPYEWREGSDNDCNALKKTFLARGFDVSHQRNLTEDELMNCLKQTSDDFNDSKHNCLVVCILTHGFEGGVVTSDGKEIMNDVIEDTICSWKLRNVIKLLIVQACQGKTTGDASQKSELATDGPNSENNLRFRNFARFMSTMNGFQSIRHKTDGSWFIQTLCEVLKGQSRIRISEWVSAVIRKVGSKTGRVNGCPAASQIPEFKSRLAAEIYFPPYTAEPAVQPADVARH